MNPSRVVTRNMQGYVEGNAKKKSPGQRLHPSRRKSKCFASFAYQPLLRAL